MSDASTVEALFFNALSLATAERAAYLAAACGDADVRRQVEKLLAAHARVGDFLDKPVGEQLAEATRDPAATTDGERPAGGRSAGLDFLTPSARPDSLGRLGPYEVLEILGQGGFAVVLRAFDPSLRRFVAVKVLSARVAATSPTRRRFLREARSSARVRHENVVQVHAVEDSPLPYIVMEFVPGENLQQRLDRTGRMSPLEAVEVGLQIAEGMAGAHATGLVHRDIKPANILLEAGPQVRVKIADFGLACTSDDSSVTQSGVIAGTPMYMAPEQANGETPDHRADLFSLGSVLYATCTGLPPFRGKGPLAVLKRVAEDTPTPVAEVAPEVPGWLADVITRLHAKKPDERFASAREVADLLRRGLAAMQRPGEVMPPPAPRLAEPPSREVPPARRRTGGRRWATAAVVVLLAGLGFTVVRLFTPVVEDDVPVVSQEASKEPDPLAAAWERSVAGLPAAQLVTAVAARLREHNPAFDGKLVPTMENGSVTGLVVSTDAIRDISAVRALRQLRALDCSGSDLGRGRLGDLAALRGLPLMNLSCRYTAVSDLSPLAGMELLTLDLRHTNVGDEGVKALAGQKGLLTLTLWGTRVTDAGMKELAGLGSLQYLSLETTQVSDVGLKELAGLSRLEQLSLYNAVHVTDGGLERLAGLKALRSVDLRGTRATAAGVGKLTAALPALSIVR